MAAQLRGSAYQPFGNDMRLHIPENTLFTYPDISVYGEDFTASEHDEETMMQPVVLVEVLSLATADYNRGNKFMLYRDIPSLREYIVIDSREVIIEVWRINSKGYWQLEEYKNLNDVLRIPAIDVAVPLMEIYEGTKLEG